MPETLRFDVLVVGAGPAGLAAAASSVQSGASVGLVDENAIPGGQIYRASSGEPHPAVRDQIRELALKGVGFFGSVTIIDAPAPNVVLGLSATGVRRFEYKKLILAVGARELFLPFPGWTLPNVMGVGGLQALVKSGLDVRGKRVVVAGSGPLLPAVGAYLLDHGATVIAIVEQTPAANLSRFLLPLTSFGSKFKQGASLMLKVGTRLRLGRWVERADGKEKLESVKLNNSDKRIECDFLACSFGFVPNLELPMLLGCEIADGFVKVDDMQNTTVENVLCAGEPTGIGGIDKSEVEGKIAGFAATSQDAEARTLFEQRDLWQAFGNELDIAFALRNELKSLATAETVVCRCEDVRLGQLSGWESGRSAKLHTRCGMGPCQGRICGPVTRYLFGCEHGTVRPPLAPTPLSGFETEEHTI